MTTPVQDESQLILQAENTPQEQFHKYLLYLEDQYHNGVSVVSDATYDRLVDIYRRKFGSREVVGAPPRGERVDLPQYLPSLDKIKTEQELKAWLRKNPGPLVLEDKIDGLTLLYYQKDGIRKLYTRGDGTIGSDVSHMLPYLKLPMLAGNFAIRGEIAFSKKKFAPYASQFSNTRNIVSGAIGAKKSFNPELAAQFDFIAYRIFNSGITPSQQILSLKQAGFQTPWAVTTNTLDFEKLVEVFLDRKANSEYDIDGLVVYSDTVKPETQYPDKYPKNMVAFKMDGETAIVTVRDMLWQASRWRVLTPVAIYDPVFLSGAELTNASGHNARFIVNSKIGLGAKIEVVRSGDTIPKILRTVEPGTAWILPKPEQGAYGWDANQVRFVLAEDNDEVRADRLKFFIKALKIKNFGPSRASALVKAGISSIEALLTITPEQLAKVEGIGPKLSQDLVDKLKEKLSGVSLAQLMNAVSFFPGVGKRRFEKIVQMYPNILEMANYPKETLVTELQKVEGIKEMATIIAEKLPEFVQWLKAHPQITVAGPRLMPTTISTGGVSPGVSEGAAASPGESLLQFAPGSPTIPQTMTNVSVVFTQYRNTPLEKKIEERGGKISKKPSRKTTDVVAGNPNLKTGSVKDAERLGVPVMTEAQFLEKYKTQLQ